MKSRQDFTLLSEYVDYLTEYYSGLVLAQIVMAPSRAILNPGVEIVERARTWGRSLALLNSKTYIEGEDGQ